MEAAVAVEVPSGSAGFTCSDDLVITRLDEAGRAEQAGVELGMRVCEFRSLLPSFLVMLVD